MDAVKCISAATSLWPPDGYVLLGLFDVGMLPVVFVGGWIVDKWGEV